MRIDDHRRVAPLLPNLFGNRRDEIELPLVEMPRAIRAMTDRVVARFDEHAVRLRIKIEEHFLRILKHESLGFRFGRAQIPAPAVNAEFIDGLPALLARFEL